MNGNGKILNCDLAIVGGGPAGASLALLAAKAGFETVLVDARDPDGPLTKDGRNFAIVRGSWQLLEVAGVTEELISSAQPLNGLEATDGGTHWFGAPSVLFSNEDLDDGRETLGYMIEAQKMLPVLDAAVSAQARLTRIAPDRFESFNNEPGRIIIRLASGMEIHAGLLAGCDGVNSPVRAAAGIGTEGRAYGKSVFAANVTLSKPHNGIARQLFTPEGPFATLPLTGDRANLAWYMKTGAAEALANLSKPEIEAELNARFSEFAGEMALVGEAIAYPLHLKIAQSMIGERVALLGDAARRINPLAGQGLNLGFKDVAALIEIMCDARHEGLDIGAATVLQRYQQWRRFDANATALAMDGIDRVFSNDSNLLKPLRGLALTLANRAGPLKKIMARQASSSQTSLPKIMRGEAPW